MRKALIILVLLSVLIGGTVSAKGMHPYGMAGLFKTWNAETIEQWGLSFGLHFDIWVFNREVEGSGYEWADYDHTDENYFISDVYSRNPFQLTLCFFDWMEFSVAPSFSARKVMDTDLERVALGELFIGTKFNPIKEQENGYLPGISLLFNFDIGSIAAADDTNVRGYDGMDFTTRGGTNIDFLLAVTKHVGKNDIFSYNVNLGYRLTLGEYDVMQYDFNEETGVTEEIVLHADYPVPDYFLYGLGLEIKATPNFSFIIDTVGKVGFTEEQARGTETCTPTDDWLQIMPGFRLSGDEFLYWDFGVGIGVLSDNPWIEVLTGFSADINLVEKDSDGDGYVDSKDACPNQPEDFDGFEDSDGCPDLDNDGDGIPDTEDACPNEAEDFDGFEDEDGCPDYDNDNDGILDVDDKCPNEPETFNGYQDEDGCPDEKPIEYAGPTVITLDGINFEPNKATMKPGSADELADAAQIMKENPSINVKIIGHTTDRGDRGFLMDLSFDRAQAVVDVLVNKYGIARHRLTAEGMGPDSPISSNSTADGRAQNRRIEFTVQ